jgi:hypothetical protein
VERDGREKGRYARSLHALGLGFPPPPPPFLSNFSSKVWLGWCQVQCWSLTRPWCWILERKDFVLREKNEKKRKKEKAHMK